MPIWKSALPAGFSEARPGAVEKGGMTIIPSEALAESRDLADITPELPILNILWMHI